MESLSYYIVSHFLIGIVAIIFGLMVFLKNRKKGVNIIFCLLATSVAIWSLAYGRWLLATDQASALFWARTLNMGATLIPVFYLHWIVSLLKLRKEKTIIFYYLLTAVFLFFSYSDHYISGTKAILQFPFWPQMNWLYLIFLIFSWCVIIIYSLVLLFIELKKAKGYYRQQIKYVIAGSLVGFLGGSTNYSLMMGYDWFPPLGSPLVAAYPIIFGYSMVRYRLMDIKFVLRNSYVYLSSFASIVIIAMTAKYVLDRYFFEISAQLDFVILILAILIFSPIKNYFYRLGNKYFFSSLYDSNEVITELSDKLRTTLEVKRIYDFIYGVLNGALHFKAFGILSYKKKEGYYSPQYNKGFMLGKNNKFLGNEELHQMFVSRNEAIVMEEIKHSYYNQRTKKAVDLLENFGVDVLMPLNVKGKTVGLIAFGPKESRDMYNDEDLGLLKIVGTQAAMAIENARLYEETLNFNIKLKKEIEKATKELKSANKRLTKFDKAKTEFISIASHQLRTPLSGIKGYLSMLQDGDFGQLQENQRRIISDLFFNTERLVHLVNVFLNISRIESGKLQLNKSEFNFVELASRLTAQMQFEANRKSLDLSFSSPAKEIIINADSDKLADVILNLIDNSIKYTPKGFVKVKAWQEKDRIFLSVKDSGLGISPAESKKIFAKFSRTERSAKVNTSGSGLGLFVVRTIIEMHGGKVSANSAGKDKGSEFIFEIPSNLGGIAKDTVKIGGRTEENDSKVKI